MQKKKPQENPAAFIAQYIEQGLKKEKGVNVRVKNIDVTIETDAGSVVVHWKYPFLKVTSTKKEARIFETKPL